MRFHFDLHNDVDTHDEEGVELPDELSARRYAEDSARIMAAESVRRGHLNLDHFIEVSDDVGRTLFKVTFADVITVTG
jgi:hypothetical protein